MRMVKIQKNLSRLVVKSRENTKIVARMGIGCAIVKFLQNTVVKIMETQQEESMALIASG
jgi:hypothetical protein